jgi:hypothetical protein
VTGLGLGLAVGAAAGVGDALGVGLAVGDALGRGLAVGVGDAGGFERAVGTASGTTVGAAEGWGVTVGAGDGVMRLNTVGWALASVVGAGCGEMDTGSGETVSSGVGETSTGAVVSVGEVVSVGAAVSSVEGSGLGVAVGAGVWVPQPSMTTGPSQSHTRDGTKDFRRNGAQSSRAGWGAGLLAMGGQASPLGGGRHGGALRMSEGVGGHGGARFAWGVGRRGAIAQRDVPL